VVSARSKRTMTRWLQTQAMGHGAVYGFRFGRPTEIDRGPGPGVGRSARASPGKPAAGGPTIDSEECGGGCPQQAVARARGLSN